MRAVRRGMGCIGAQITGALTLIRLNISNPELHVGQLTLSCRTPPSQSVAPGDDMTCGLALTSERDMSAYTVCTNTRFESIRVSAGVLNTITIPA